MKNKKKPFPKLRSGFEFKNPGPYYFGGALHYIGKDSKIKHSYKMKIPKYEIMTKTEFNKKFYDKSK
jgi:hypothetical protein